MRPFLSIGASPAAFALLLVLWAASGVMGPCTSRAAGKTGAPTSGELNFNLRDVTDPETGIALSLPSDILGSAQKSSLGTTWTTSDRRLKIATLNFKNKKTLLAVYRTIRGRAGRNFSKDVLDSKSFILQGGDQDGSVFFVRVEERGGEVRGVSITCERDFGSTLSPLAQKILQTFRGFPASGSETGNPAVEASAARNMSCSSETAELVQLASGVNLKLDMPAEVRAGESLHFSWEAPARFPTGRPVYAILAVSGEARLEVKLPPLPVASDGNADAASTSETAPGSSSGTLPGFIVLRPPAAGPKGIGFASGTTRVFIPLFQAGSHLSGSFGLQLYEAGAISLKLAVVAKTVCGERILKAEPEHTVAVVPARAEIVVQDPYDIAVPKASILSNHGRYLLQVFEDHYRVFDVAAGAKLVDRPGHDPGFSPSGRFVAANTGAGESYEIVDLLSRQPVATVSGLVIAWAEDDAYVVAASAGNWAPLTVRPTLISAQANPVQNPVPQETEEDRLSISVQSPLKNAPSWEVFGIRIDADSGLVAFSNETLFDVKDSPKKASVYELASGQEAPPRPLEKGWHSRSPIRFSHVFNFVSEKIYNPEWAKERAKSKVLKEFAKLKITHKALDRNALALLGQSPNTIKMSADWRALRTLGEDLSGEAVQASFTGELGRFGIAFADEVSREEILPIYSVLRASVDGDRLSNLLTNPRVQEFTKGLKERLSREVPAAAKILKEGMLSDNSINLAAHLEGLWRWDVKGRPLWLLEGIDNQGSGGFAQINSWLLRGDTPGGKVETFLNDIPEDYNPHITGVDDNTVRLKARLFLDRYLIAGMAGPKIISVVDLQGEQPRILIKDIPHADLLADVRLSSDARHIVQINSDGQFFIHDISSKKMVLAGRYVDGEIIFYTPEAYFWSSYEGSHFVQLRFPGLSQLASFRQYDAVLNRPDFVRSQLAKSPPPLPKPSLTPPPSLDMDVEDGPQGANLGEENRIRVRAQSGTGLERLRFFYDGQFIKEEALSGNEFQGVVNIPKSHHARRLTALAVDRKGVVSAPRALRLKPDGQGTNTLYAVLAGVDKYSSPGIDLTYAKSDAARLAAAIEARQAVYYAKRHVELLGDKTATAKSIAAALEKAVTLASPEDTILFFFAGHGVEGSDGLYYLAASDIRREDVEHTGLPWSQIAAILAKSKARAVVILDSCHSGLSGAEGLATNDDAVRSLLSGSHAPVLVFAGSKGRESSLEGPTWQGGLFTFALTKALLDVSPPGVAEPAIDISQLYRKVHEIVARESNGQQTPWLARQDLIGDFALF